MVDYTWMANLLREIETFATVNKVTSLSESLTIACVALLSDTEGKAEICADARIWLDAVAARQFVPSCTTDESIASVLSGKPSLSSVPPVARSRWESFDPTLVQ